MKNKNFSWKFRVNFLFCILVITLLCQVSLFSQGWLPLLKNSRGDTLNYTWPPADSTYIRNELIIYFRPKALHLEKLCFDIEPPTITQKEKEPNIQTNYVSHFQRSFLFNQRFSVDSLIADSLLLAVIKFYGGDSLRRMSITSPCRDTFAIAHVYGDTLKCYDYLYMVLHFNNDTSVVNAGINLNIFQQGMINWASFNLIYKLAREPQYDYSYANQTSFHDNTWDFPMCRFSTAWDYQIGNGVKVAVIDNGIDYFHCDLGGGNYGTNEKVLNGWNYLDGNAIDFYSCSNHGTSVAGIIGAYTNYSKCATNTSGVAGIAGGWEGPINEGGEGIGCQLIGLDIHVPVGWECTNEVGDKAWTAFKEVSTWTPSGGDEFNAEIINFSVYTEDLPDIAMRDAVNMAYQCGISVVASAGNHGEEDIPAYPASYDQAWITSVGASNIYKARVGYSNKGNNLDFIAPGGQSQNGVTTPDRYIEQSLEQHDKIDFTSYYNRLTPNSHNLYQAFGGTSAAAPHVSGLIALIRADIANNWNAVGEPLEPEDYEGMLKASCEDITEDYNQRSDGDFYQNYYDPESGWGFVRADKVFQMIRDRGYKLIHLKNDNYSSFTPENYKENQNIYFQNSGYPTNKTWLIPPNLYTGIKIWKLQGTITIPGMWLHNDNNPLFVWGRSGQANKSGLANSYNMVDNGSQLTTYQSGYTQITDGQNGNSYVDGIYHNQDLVVNVLTYQYEGNFDGIYRKIPPDNQIGANISVFGVRLPDDVDESEISSVQMSAFISPNPVKDNFQLELYMNHPAKLFFEIYNCLGAKLFKLDENRIYTGYSSVSFNVEEFPAGIYILKISSYPDVKILKFIVGGK